MQISNPGLGLNARLDMGDEARPRRTVEVPSPGGPPRQEVDSAGDGQELWLDFEWTGPSEGDVCRRSPLWRRRRRRWPPAG